MNRPTFIARLALLSFMFSCAGDRPLEKVIVPAGYRVMVSLRDRLDSSTNHAGDLFDAETIEPITVDGRLVMKAGARVHGRLAEVAEAGSDSGLAARMTIVFDEIEPPKGPSCLIESRPITLTGGTRGYPEREGSMILMDQVAGDGAIVLVARGGEVDLSPGQKLRVELAQPVIFPALPHPPSSGKR